MQLMVEMTPLAISNSVWVFSNLASSPLVSRIIKSFTIFNERLTVQFPIANMIIWTANNGDLKHLKVSFSFLVDGLSSGKVRNVDRRCGTCPTLFWLIIFFQSFQSMVPPMVRLKSQGGSFELIKKVKKIFFTGSLTGSGPEIQRFLQPTEQIWVRTTCSCYQLLPCIGCSI